MFNYIKNLFSRFNRENSKFMNGVEVVDMRSKRDEFEIIKIDENEDPFIEVIASACLKSGKPIIGNIKNGKLEITD